MKVGKDKIKTGGRDENVLYTLRWEEPNNKDDDDDDDKDHHRSCTLTGGRSIFLSILRVIHLFNTHKYSIL